MIRALTLIVVAAAGLSSSAQDSDSLEKQIDRAITKGADWLKKQQRPDGSFPESSNPTYVPGEKSHPYKGGNAALALLALLKSDVDPADPVIKKGFTFLFAFFGSKGNNRAPYETGAALMALEALYEGREAAKTRKSGHKVKERAGDFKEPKYSLSGQDAAFAGGLVKELTDSQSKTGGWRYGPNLSADDGDEDVSATQIALLGLKSAARMKLPVNPAIFQKALTYMLGAQEKDGPKVDRPGDVSPKAGDRGTFVAGDEDRARGWAYMIGSKNAEEARASGAMTCAGITSLLIIKSVIGKTLSKDVNGKVEQSIYDGFAWIYTNWTVTANPGRGRSHFYYLYGLERIGALGCYERICNHVWFREGAEVLVARQADDGGWTDSECDPRQLYATSFALLFLKRGTVPIGDVMTGR